MLRKYFLFSPCLVYKYEFLEAPLSYLRSITNKGYHPLVAIHNNNVDDFSCQALAQELFGAFLSFLILLDFLDGENGCAIRFITVYGTVERTNDFACKKWHGASIRLIQQSRLSEWEFRKWVDSF